MSSTTTAPARSDSRARRFLAQIYAYSFLDELVFIYPLYAVMFADCGMTALQISVLFTVWSVTGLVLEVPSGALADVLPRKYLLLGAQVVKTIAFGCWMVHPTFWGFLAGFVCWGTSGAFCSGTFEALVYDELKHLGCERGYARAIGRARGISQAAVLIASVCAAPMTGLGYPAIIAMSLVSLALSCVPVLFIRPVARDESTGEREYLHLLKQGVGEAAKNRVIRGLMVFVCFALTLGALDEYWPVIGRELGLTGTLISLFVAADCAAAGLATAVAHRFEHLPDRRFYAGYALAGSLLLMTAFVRHPYGMLLILGSTFLLGTLGVVLEARIQHAVSVDARATVLSVKGLFTEVGVIPVFLGFGITAHRSSYIPALGVCAGVMIVTGLLYTVLGRAPSSAPTFAAKAAEAVEVVE